MGSKLANFRLPEELDYALEEAKWQLRKSKSEIVREALEKYLKEKTPNIYENYKKTKKEK